MASACNIVNTMDAIKPDRKKTELTDGTILLRPYRMSDAAETYRAIKSSLKEMGVFLPFAHPDYSLKESKAWLKQRPASWKAGEIYDFGIFDAKTGEQIGGCGLNNIGKVDGYANLGYWVRSDRTGRGIAVAATRLLAKWGFDVLKLNRIEILVAVENTRSLRVAAKAGAKREGVLRNRIDIRGITHDAVMHSLIPGEV